MPLDLRRNVVPAEYVGRAWLLLQRVRAADEQILVSAGRVGDMLKRRLRRNPKLRPDLIADVFGNGGTIRRVSFVSTSKWQALPEKRPTKLRIGECRLCFCVSTRTGWDTDEPNASISLIWASTFKGGLLGGLEPPIAMISRHAIARRYQRGRDRSDAAVIADLGALLGNRRDDAVLVRDGVWLGERVHSIEHGKPHSILAIRTYVDGDDFDHDLFVQTGRVALTRDSRFDRDAARRAEAMQHNGRAKIIRTLVERHVARHGLEGYRQTDIRPE